MNKKINECSTVLIIYAPRTSCRFENLYFFLTYGACAHCHATIVSNVVGLCILVSRIRATIQCLIWWDPLFRSMDLQCIHQ